MKGNYNFYIMQNGKPEKIKYSSNLKVKLSKKEKENLRRMRKHRSGSISFEIDDPYKDLKTKIKEQVLKTSGGRRMKEVTYEDWQKNPTPRMMWVWDSSENNKKQLKVIYISKEDITYPVIALSHSDIDSSRYKHCAEIDEFRRMTHKELSRWLREHPSREYKYQTSDYIYSAFNYRECKQDEEVHKDVRIREDGGEWREPLVEDGVKEAL